MRILEHVLKMALSTPVSFSSNGEYCMYSSPDGVLKVYDTSTSKISQQYTPSSHLTATCTCLSWGPKRPSAKTPKKKKKRKSLSDDSAEQEKNDIVAIGTSSGNILLYSIVKADIQSQLDKGHSESVNDLCWDENQGYLYSCSNDHNVIQWDVSTANVRHKWKADKGSVHSMCLCSSNHLLTAGRSIKLWNVETKELLKTFTGHKTEIFRLLPLPLSADASDSPENMYFLSAAQNDRIINAWQINTSSSDKNSITSFSLPEEPTLLDVCQQSTEQVVMLCAVTRSGQVVIFEHKLNGRLKKPLKPKVLLQVSTSGAKDSLPLPIPILAAQICDQDILIVHGNFLKPTFERVRYNSADPVQCLIREDPRKVSLQTDRSLSKIQTPDVSKDSTVLVPGLMAPSGPSQEPGRRSKRKPSITDMSMEERLNAISVDHPSHPTREPPQADTLARLLTQGLQSQDKKLINNVLMQASEKVVQNTVRKLPIQAIIPLVQELSSRMHTHAQSSSKILRWIKTLLTIHTSYLMTFPDMVENLSTLYQMMDSRTMMFNKLSRLQGKLDLVLSQVTAQDQPEVETESLEQPLLMYQEESSDEDFGLDDFAPTQSDTEDNVDLFDDIEEMDKTPDQQNGDEEEKDSDDDNDDEMEDSPMENGDEEMESE
ncbi:WD repeat-containing protein 43-like [Mytilus galloprovincialis]|uniref:WD repeat-containing protein 43-like n=1 Tax=Mytilus galloprovincialis TaxID=29158 RepID=UPI003F7CC6C1